MYGSDIKGEIGTFRTNVPGVTLDTPAHTAHRPCPTASAMICAKMEVPALTKAMGTAACAKQVGLLTLNHQGNLGSPSFQATPVSTAKSSRIPASRKIHVNTVAHAFGWTTQAHNSSANAPRNGSGKRATNTSIHAMRQRANMTGFARMDRRDRCVRARICTLGSTVKLVIAFEHNLP